MKKKLIYILFVLTIIPFLSSIGQTNNTPEKYSQVRIFATSKNETDKMADAGLHIDHALRKTGFIDAWLSAEEIKMLKKSGVSYNILIPDWKQYYESLPKMSSFEIQKSLKNSTDVFNVSHSIYGTMGGFLKYSEVTAKLDSMRLQYPNLVSAKFFIDSTINGKKIWTVRVTKDPDAPTGRPEIWYHSLIHAREPESMEHMIYFMYWLLENYNVDPLATYILNNRELYFTPVLNPDGYIYNETTNPGGGGLWRKNRKVNAGGSFGVDLNRNYGTFQFWNSSNGGSSTSASSDTYRGLSPFSENETRGVMKFINTRNIAVVLGSHTYGNYLIKPWAWQDPAPTPDDNKFTEYLADMTKINHYTTGTPSQTVGYFVRGSADDWYYNDSVHSPHRIIAMTPESGTTGFWPTQAEIIPLAQDMLFTNQYTAMIGGAYVYPVSVNFNKTVYASGESGTLKIKFKNKGLQSAQNLKIECSSPGYYLNIPITFYTYSNLNSFQSDSSSFGFTISSAAPLNSAIPVNITFKQNDSLIVYQETKYILTGNGYAVFSDSAENGFTNWTTNQGWAITSAQSHSPTRSYTDSPLGNYADNANNSMTMTFPVNLSNSSAAYLNFWHKYNTEAGYDFCYVEASSNNGSTWQAITSYNGNLAAWTQQTLDVSAYAAASSQLKIRFTLKSDANTTADGWYVDDIKLATYNTLIGSVVTNLNLTLAEEGFYDTSSNSLRQTDTVAVYLKNISSPYSIVDSARGVIDSLTLSGNFEFKNIPSGIYYIVVRHRNSIETWSKSGGESFTFGGTASYDFTSSANQAYGNNLKLVGKKYSMYSGDVDQNGQINLSDLILIFNDQTNFISGYVPSDVNGDYILNLADLIITYNNSVNFVTKLTPP
ncbi:MAG: M14 family zinc carboxypeptidase [bacterium]